MKSGRFSLPLFAIVLILSNAASVSASAAEREPDEQDEQGQHDHDEIVVSGHPPVDFGILAATASLDGDHILSEMKGQIGDVLDGLPGVSSTSFAPGASRPVLRGFSGDRVAVLVDGIGSIDASNVSVDHAVVFDALTVEHVDVFYGPSVLLFGSQAIGGAVNALDTRIPRQVPETWKMRALASYGTNAQERAYGASLDFKLAPNLVGHLDGNWRESENFRAGGFVNSSSLRKELLDEAADHRLEGEADRALELEEAALAKGRVSNSYARSSAVGAGLAYIDANADIGVSFQRFETRYGVPVRPGAEHGHGPETGVSPQALAELAGGIDDEGENVAIDLEQTRFDLRAGLRFDDGLIESVQLRGATGDYRHVELEGTEIGTRFDGNGTELRLDVIQRETDGWRGRSGIQYFKRKLEIEGAEAFVPDYSVERLGLFTLQSLELAERLDLEFAGRYESAMVRSPEVAFRKRFDLWSAAAGLAYNPGSEWTLGVNYVHGARAPSPEELLPNGLHVATQSFEVGSTDFGIEKSDGFEAYARYSNSSGQFSLTGYRIDFDGFISAMPTGGEVDGFPVYQYVQLPARYQGFEASGRLTAAEWDEGRLILHATADYTHAKFKQVGPVPRIPPLRIQGGAELNQGLLDFNLDVEWNDRQSRVAQISAPVPGFTLVNAGIDWHALGRNGPLLFMLSAENILDVTARRAASFTRDFVPLPGRDIRLTARYAF